MMTDHQKKNWKSYCSELLELVENYQQVKADNFACWCIHHRLEILPDGTRVSAKELIDQNLYFGRPASELIFMRFREHSALHSTGNTYMKGKHLSEETRQKMSVNNGRFWKGKHHSADARKKMSESRKGKNNPFFGKHHSAETSLKISAALKGKHHSAETRRKIAEANKGKHRSAETRLKMSAAHKGRTFSEESRRKMSEAKRGKQLSAEHRQKMSKTWKGMLWWNDGVSCKRSKECPGEGWTRGRLRFK